MTHWFLTRHCSNQTKRGFPASGNTVRLIFCFIIIYLFIFHQEIVHFVTQENPDPQTCCVPLASLFLVEKKIFHAHNEKQNKRKNRESRHLSCLTSKKCKKKKMFRGTCQKYRSATMLDWTFTLHLSRHKMSGSPHFSTVSSNKDNVY